MCYVLFLVININSVDTEGRRLTCQLMLLVTQARISGITLDASISLTLQIQSHNMYCPPNLQHIARVCPFPTSSTANTLVQAVISHWNFYISHLLWSLSLSAASIAPFSLLPRGILINLVQTCSSCRFKPFNDFHFTQGTSSVCYKARPAPPHCTSLHSAPTVPLHHPFPATAAPTVPHTHLPQEQLPCLPSVTFRCLLHGNGNPLPPPFLLLLFFSWPVSLPLLVFSLFILLLHDCPARMGILRLKMLNFAWSLLFVLVLAVPVCSAWHVGSTSHMLIE